MADATFFNFWMEQVDSMRSALNPTLDDGSSCLLPFRNVLCNETWPVISECLQASCHVAVPAVRVV